MQVFAKNPQPEFQIIQFNNAGIFLRIDSRPLPSAQSSRRRRKYHQNAESFQILAPSFHLADLKGKIAYTHAAI